MLCSNAPQEVQREDKQSMEAEAKQSGKNDQQSTQKHQ